MNLALQLVLIYEIIIYGFQKLNNLVKHWNDSELLYFISIMYKYEPIPHQVNDKGGNPSKTSLK